MAVVAETEEWAALERYRPPQGVMVTSLYLPIDRARDQARGYLNVFRRLRQEATERARPLSHRQSQSLREDLDRMEAWLRTHRGFEEKGVAFFSCAADGFWAVLPLSALLEPAVVTDVVTYRLPLLAQAWSQPPGIVLVVGRQTARFLCLQTGSLVERGSFCDEVPQNVREGGWANLQEKRIDRHILDHLYRHVRQAVAALAEVVAACHARWLVLAGPGEVRALARQELPAEWGRMLIGELDAPAEASPAELDRTVRDLVSRWREEEARGLLARAVELASRGQAALGPADVAAASMRGAVRQLVMRSGLRLGGYSCSCGFVTPSAEPWRCLNCLSDQPGAPREAAQHLADAAAEQGAELAFVRADAFPAGTSGVAALLRF